MSVALVGHYSAYSCMLSLPAPDVEKMLMRGCKLAPQTVTPAGEHPVILLLGNETNVKFPALRRMPAVDYLEATLSVPWVFCPKKPNETMAHVSRLWLNKLMPTLGGIVLGFPKRLARNEMSPTSYAVRTFLFGTRVLTANYTALGAPGKPRAFPHFAPLETVFEQLFLQRLMLIAPLVSLKMNWEMKLTAVLQPIHMELEIYRGAEIPPGKYAIPSIERQTMGAFRIDVDWQLSWPDMM